MGKLIEELEIEILSFLEGKIRAQVKFIKVQATGLNNFNAEVRSGVVFLDGHRVLQEINVVSSAFVGEQ